MSDQEQHKEGTIHGNRIYYMERKLLDYEQEIIDIKEQMSYLNEQLAEITTRALFAQQELNELKNRGAK